MIITDPNKLATISKPTTWGEVERLNLINRLRAANDTAWCPGCGLAAIQIGVPLRFAWYKWRGREHTIMNPEIVSLSGKYKRHEEGCLSIPDKWSRVYRHYKIVYMNDGTRKTAKGLRARIIQHEIDHMNGILNTDRG